MTMKTIAIAIPLLSILWIGCARGQTPQTIPPFLTMPPVEYDHPYEGELILRREDEPTVRERCRHQMIPGNVALACSQRWSVGKCQVWIVTDDVIALHAKPRGWTYEMILRHEIGHCNGWR